MKLFACFLLVAVGWAAGGEAAKRQTEKYGRLCGVLSLLRTMNDGIRCTRTELRKIFASFHDDALEKCGFLACLSSGTFISESWKNAVLTLDADEDVTAALLSLGDGLGTTDLVTQTERIELCASSLERKKNEEDKSLAGKVRSFRALGALASLAAAIILY